MSLPYGYNLGCGIEGMNALPAGCVDLVLTSPPYDALRTYDDASEWSHLKFQGMANAIERALAPGGVCVWIVNDQTIDGSRTGSCARQQLYFQEVCKLFFHDHMIYEKSGSSHPASRDSNRYSQVWENMFVFSKGKPRTANLICDVPRGGDWFRWGKGRMRKKEGDFTEKTWRKDKYKEEPNIPRNNIWYVVNNFKDGQRDKRAYDHPAVFPESLAADHVKTWSSKGDLVVDPMCGSGTTGRVSHDLGRKFIGFEINKKYWELSRALDSGKRLVV